MRESRAPTEERRDHLRGPTGLLSPLIVRRYPREVDVPALSSVGRTDVPLTAVVRLQRVPTPEALKALREERLNLEAERGSLRSHADPRWTRLTQEAEAAEELESALVGRSTRLWRVITGFLVRGRSAAETERRVGLVRDPLLWTGFTFHDPAYRVSPLLASTAPGSAFPPGLSHPMTDEGVAALLPLWEDRCDERGGALVGLHAFQRTPLFWDRFAHPSHSSAIFGETGSGKTYASAIGWMRSRYFHPDLSLFVLDPLGGLSEVVRQAGGTVYRAGGDTLAINPLDPETTGGDVRAKTARVVTLLRALFPSLTDEESAVIDTLLSQLYSETYPDTVPLLGDLRDAVRACKVAPPRLATLLDSVTRGSLMHLNQPTRLTLSSPMLAFDLSALTAEEMPFLLTLLLDLVYGEMRRRPGPKLLVIDEAHYLTRNPAVSGFLDYLVRHVRHFNGGLELLSQNPMDFLADEHAKSVLLNLDSLLLLHLKDGGEGIASLLGLAESEVDWLRHAKLPAASGYAEGLFRTGDLHLPVAIVSSEAEHDRLTRAFRDERERRMRHPVGPLASPSARGRDAGGESRARYQVPAEARSEGGAA